MESRKIEYIAPTRRAFEGMKNILFRPFDIQKWFILGFSAWLATLGEGGGSSGGGSYEDTDFGGDDADGSSFLTEATTWIQENLALILIIGAVVVLIVAVIWIAILWVQSRGKFMFLDNVLHNRTQISEPWKRFRHVANSLFFWKLIVGLTFLACILGLSAWALYLAWPMIEAEAFDSSSIPSFIIIGSFFLIFIVAFSYVMMLLENFVIPLMHRDGIPTTTAWRKLLALHRVRTIHFIGFFFWVMLVGLLTGIAVMVLVVGTCCIAVIPLIIPYLGAVLLLPLTVFLRLIGPEFLKQFGDDFDTMRTEVPTPPALN